jgi:hypothetical protein
MRESDWSSDVCSSDLKTEALITRGETLDALIPSMNTKGGANLMTNNVDGQKKENAWQLESGLDVLMLLLYAEGGSGKTGEPIEGITRLDKIMYLLSQSKEFSSVVEENYKFQADNFGPFAPELFDDIQALKQECIIELSSEKITKNKIDTVDEESVEKVLEDSDDMKVVSWKKYPLETYKLTDLGMKIAAQLYSNLSIQQKEELKKIKKTFGTMSMKNLLYYVYSTAPSKMLEKSKIRKDVLGQ